MPDPIWLDTNILARVANGDTALEALLRLQRADGHELLLVPAANNELLYGNPLTMHRSDATRNKSVVEQQPSPATRAKIELTKVRLGITVDMSAEALPSSTRVGYNMQDHVKRPKNLAVPASLNNISESDSLVLSQIMSSAQARRVDKPVMMTAETGRKGMIAQAHLYRVNVVTPPPTPPANGGGGSEPPAGPSSPPVARTGPGPQRGIKLGALPVTIGRLIIGAGVQMVFAYLMQKLRDKVDKRIIDSAMKAFEPEIQSFAEAYQKMILDNLISGKAAYVTTRVRIEYMNQGVQNGMDPAFIRSDPLVHLDSLMISEKNHNGEATHSFDPYFGGYTDVYDYTYSVSVGENISEEQRKVYRDAYAQINLYRLVLKNGSSLTNSKRDEIKQEIDELYDALNEGFGRFSDFKPNANLWTKDGYAAMTGTMKGGVVY